MSLPQHLHDLAPTKSFGSLYFASGTYYVNAEPFVMDMFKRMFPGSRIAEGGTAVTYTRRNFENLHWMMMRYPLRIEDPGLYELHLKESREFATKRDIANSVAPVAPPPQFKAQLFPYQARMSRG